jgi:hypothetical protein
MEHLAEVNKTSRIHGTDFPSGGLVLVPGCATAGEYCPLEKWLGIVIVLAKDIRLDGDRSADIVSQVVSEKAYGTYLMPSLAILEHHFRM